MATPSPAEHSAIARDGRSDARASAEQSATATDSPPVVAAARAEAVVDLDAISANTERLRAHAGGRDLMAVVKADGYGHGIEQAGWAARRGGATWLGVAFLDEALRLRADGDRGPILSWLAVPGEAYADGIAADVEVAAYTVGQLREIAAAARAVGRQASVQLKLDSGLGRGGSHPDDWPQLVEEAVAQQTGGHVRITGVWSHFACSDEPDHPSVAAQLEEFDAGVAHAIASGLEPEHLHLANSAAVLGIPDSWFTMVRPGIAIYGVSPFADGGGPIELTPAMTLRATLALVKRVHAGQGVSYGHTYVTDRETTLGLVPIGYGDGIPRIASKRGPVAIGGARFRVAGRVCMDQFVVDLGDHRAAVGDPVVVFGDARRGEPTAHDWAAASDSIGYEVVTRVGSRVPRVYVGADA
jgi:alanine racemase